MPKSRTYRFMSDQRGSIIIIVALSIMFIGGMAALAVDVASAYVFKTRLQATADAAALAAISQLPDESATLATALEYAGKNMSNAQHGTVLANTDMNTGNWDRGTRTFTPGGVPVNAVRIITRRAQANGNPVRTYFAGILGYDTVDIVTSAVASKGALPACLLALDPTLDAAIGLSGDSEARLDNCGAAANSSSSSALSLTDGAAMDTESVSVVGDIDENGGLTSVNPPETGSPPAADPLASVDVPAFSGCGGVPAPL